MRSLKVVVTYIYFIFIITIGTYSSASAKGDEQDLNQYKFSAFIIYPEIKDGPKLLYLEDKFGEIDDDLQREEIEVRKILSSGTYITSNDYAYNAYQFELETIANELKKKFYFPLQEGKRYFFIIGFDNQEKPNITLIDENKGVNFLKKLRNIN